MGKDDDLKRRNIRPKICLFGHFGTNNFGNEATLQTILYHLGRHLPEADIACVCTGFEAIASGHGIRAVPISPTLASRWTFHSRVARLLRKVFIGAPSELYRWWLAFRTLKDTDMFIIPGTGLLTDAYGLGWGPYSLFKWSLMAKVRGCKLFSSASVRARSTACSDDTLLSQLFPWRTSGPFATMPARLTWKVSAFVKNSDRVYPDLVFSLPEAMLPHSENREAPRRIVGLGLMAYAGKYSVANPRSETYTAYLENLAIFVKWLLANNYDIRLLIGDICDTPVTKEFKSLLNGSLGTPDETALVMHLVLSVAQLLSQLAETDIVVATRFHNVLLALLLDKPVIAISFHHKCASLMSEMGLAEYCHDINHMNADRLINNSRTWRRMRRN